MNLMVLAACAIRANDGDTSVGGDPFVGAYANCIGTSTNTVPGEPDEVTVYRYDGNGDTRSYSNASSEVTETWDLAHHLLTHAVVYSTGNGYDQTQTWDGDDRVRSEITWFPGNTTVVTTWEYDHGLPIRMVLDSQVTTWTWTEAPPGWSAVGEGEDGNGSFVFTAIADGSGNELENHRTWEDGSTYDSYSSAPTELGLYEDYSGSLRLAGSSYDYVSHTDLDDLGRADHGVRHDVRDGVSTDTTESWAWECP